MNKSEVFVDWMKTNLLSLDKDCVLALHVRKGYGFEQHYCESVKYKNIVKEVLDIIDNKTTPGFVYGGNQGCLIINGYGISIEWALYWLQIQLKWQPGQFGNRHILNFISKLVESNFDITICVKNKDGSFAVMEDGYRVYWVWNKENSFVEKVLDDHDG